MARSWIEAMESRLLYARALGIDVSHYNNENNTATQTINWTSVAASKSFVFMKATEDTYYTDPYFNANYNGVKAAGMKVGVYHFGRPGTTSGGTISSDATAEANYFYNVASKAMGAGYLPPVLDLESGNSLSQTNLSLWANTFNNRIKTLTGVTPLIYLNGNYAGLTDSSVAQWPLWIANPSNPSNVDTATPNDYQWSTWKFWQYSWTGTVSGISGAVDLDVFNGTVSDLNTFIASYSTPAAPVIKVQQSVNVIANNQTTPIDFGTVTQGMTGTSKTFTISNTGNADLTTGNVAIPAGYTVLDPLKATIAVGGSDSLTLQQTTTTAGTFAGNVSFSTNVPGTSTFSFPITGKVLPSDTTPPTIVAANYDYTSATPGVSFTFSEDVAASLALSDFVAVNDTTAAAAAPTGYTYNNATNTATLSWSGGLADGNYTLSLAAAGVNDAAGNILANSYAFGFFALLGDISRDRSVDVVDLGILSSHWQSTTATFADGDLSRDGFVDVVDLGVLSSNWQKSLPAPAQPDGLRVVTAGGASPLKSALPLKAIPPSKAKVTAPISQSVLV